MLKNILDEVFPSKCRQAGVNKYSRPGTIVARNRPKTYQVVLCLFQVRSKQ